MVKYALFTNFTTVSYIKYVCICFLVQAIIVYVLYACLFFILLCFYYLRGE